MNKPLAATIRTGSPDSRAVGRMIISCAAQMSVITAVSLPNQMWDPTWVGEIETHPTLGEIATDEVHAEEHGEERR